jgi:hypothetical protein
MFSSLTFTYLCTQHYNILVTQKILFTKSDAQILSHRIFTLVPYSYGFSDEIMYGTSVRVFYYYYNIFIKFKIARVTK